MEEALRRIEAALREKKPASRIDDFLPAPPVQPQEPSAGLGIEHYGKVSTVVEGGRQEAGAEASGQPVPVQATPAQGDARSRIAAGSKELSLDDLSSSAQQPGEALKTQQLGGSRFHELSLDDLSSPPQGDDTEN